MLSTDAVAGFWGAAAALLLLPLAGSVGAGLLGITTCLGFAGLARGGFSVNHMDIAPRHAGVVMGFSNTAGTLAGVSCDVCMHWLTSQDVVHIIRRRPATAEWRLD